MILDFFNLLDLIPNLFFCVEFFCLCSRVGKVLSIGRSSAPMQTIPLFEAADKEIDLMGSFRYHDTYPQVLLVILSV
jgi:hypothetical protein